MNGFKSEARRLMLMKNLAHVCLGFIFALGATGAYAGCFGSASEKRCRDVENASKQAQKEGEARRQEYVKNGGKLHDNTAPIKAGPGTAK